MATKAELAAKNEELFKEVEVLVEELESVRDAGTELGNFNVALQRTIVDEQTKNAKLVDQVQAALNEKYLADAQRNTISAITGSSLRFLGKAINHKNDEIADLKQDLQHAHMQIAAAKDRYAALLEQMDYYRSRVWTFTGNTGSYRRAV